MTVLLTLTIALLITFIGSRVAVHFKYPSVLGQFVASLFLAIPLIKTNLFIPESIGSIETLAEIGIIFLLLLTGLETDANRVKESKKDAILIALFGSIVPLLAGILLGYVIGLQPIESIVLGIGLSITAEGTNLAILLQIRKLKTKLGSILLGAGILDDIFGIFYLSIILIISHHNGIGSILLFPLKLIIFITVSWFASLIIPKILAYFEEGKRKEVAMFNVVILIALIFAIISELAGLSAIIGAFMAGIILQKSFLLKRDEKHEEHEIEVFLFGFIIPFFFINISLNFDFHSLIENPVLILGVVLVAIAGKIIGTLMVKPFSKLKWQQLYLIGWGMNSRGVMELIIAKIALKANLISSEIYSAIVLMAIITSIIFPVFLKRIIKKHPKIMN